jgi:hypothetical protein
MGVGDAVSERFTIRVCLFVHLEDFSENFGHPEINALLTFTIGRIRGNSWSPSSPCRGLEASSRLT